MQGMPTLPLGYGNKKIGLNDDTGWVEYLLLKKQFRIHFQQFCFEGLYFGCEEIACELKELMAEGLKIQPMEVWNKLLMDEQSDSFHGVVQPLVVTFF
ncbi:hypothetical protein PanWU01x14_136610 [Parasponia andersonii]|uniref:Uncharacterized protein n=1 Tax=Parasponia andersonii TaxID=3476 RepID=A0A2P5CNX1_PARAD|nr:hypothetical protein PanWU01x14_136610 [Parasponia andersonii]